MYCKLKAKGFICSLCLYRICVFSNSFLQCENCILLCREPHSFSKKKMIPINCVILRIISMNDCFSITSLHMIMQRTPSFSCKKTPKKTSFWELFLWMTVSIASWYKENNFFVHPQSFLFYFIWVCIEWIQKIICSLF